MHARRTLVIIGHDAVRTLLREALVEEGYRVVLAGGGEGAGAALRERPALIVLDANEPPDECPLCDATVSDQL